MIDWQHRMDYLLTFFFTKPNISEALSISQSLITSDVN
jgi:hypothetical protein